MESEESANEAALIFYALSCANLLTNAYKIYEDKTRELAESDPPTFQECVRIRNGEPPEVLSIEKCLIFLLSFDKMAQQRDTDTANLPALNTKYTDRVLLYWLGSGHPRLRRGEAQNLCGIFTNVAFIRIDDMGSEIELVVHQCDNSQPTSSINIYFAPFPKNTDIKERIESGTEGSKILIPVAKGESKAAALYRTRLEHLSKKITNEGIPSIVFGPELEGSPASDGALKQIAISNPRILLAAAPSFHQENGQNGSLVVFQSNDTNYSRRIAKRNPAKVNGRVEAIDVGERISLHLFYIPHFGSILICICSDMFDADIQKLIQRILPAIIIVQSFTPDYSSFRSEMRRLGSEFIPVILGNSCSASDELSCVIYSTKNLQKSRDKELMRVEEGPRCSKNCREERNCYFKWTARHSSKSPGGGNNDCWLELMLEKENG